MHCTMHIMHSNLQLQLVATILAHLFLWLTCLTAGAPSMPGVRRKAIDSADTLRPIAGDNFALQPLQKLMQPLSMVATSMFLICVDCLLAIDHKSHLAGCDFKRALPRR